LFLSDNGEALGAASATALFAEKEKLGGIDGTATP
jgi:hypothetical protein